MQKVNTGSLDEITSLINVRTIVPCLLNTSGANPPRLSVSGTAASPATALIPFMSRSEVSNWRLYDIELHSSI